MANAAKSWLDRQRGKVDDGLEGDVATSFGEQAWCHGSGFSLADIAVGARWAT
jgi:glutathione S-transferase